MYFREFLISLYKYLIGNENCDNNIIRKHSKSLEKWGEFSFSLDTMLRLADVSIPALSLKTKDTNITEIQELLVKESKNWQLHIFKCICLNNNIHIFIDRVSSFKKVIEQALKQKHRYGSHKVNFSKKISLVTDIENLDVNKLNLSQLRLRLLKDVLLRLLEFNECNDNSLQEASVHLSLKLNKNSDEKVILCGLVLSEKGASCVTAEEFYRKRTIDMRLTAQHKYGLRMTSDQGWQEFFEKLGHAAVTIDLLQNKPSRPLTVNLNDPTSSSSKGASFILYNCARLATLFKEFEKKVTANLYPALPSFDSIDFSLLTQPEEWELLFTSVLQFPDVVNSCLKDLLNHKVTVHNVCSALSGMCSTFSVYYRRVRILTEPRSHLFPVLHARIYLLKSVEQVLHNGLYLLHIQPVKQM